MPKLLGQCSGIAALSGPACKWKHCVSESLAVAAGCDLLALIRNELTLAILTQFENLSQKGFL